MIVIKKRKENRNDKGGTKMERARKLIGETVYLSPLMEEDAGKFYEWMNDMEVTNYVNSTSKVYSYKNEQDFI